MDVRGEEMNEVPAEFKPRFLVWLTEIPKDATMPKPWLFVDTKVRSALRFDIRIFSSINES